MSYQTHAASPRLANIKETARALGVSTRTVNTLVQRGQIPSVKVGGLRRFRIDAVLAALEAASAS
jgi:excisionase family DNA binding protein